MTDALLLGLLFGLSAGLAPGPLLTLVITETLQHGRAAGIRVALAPLCTDVPIVAACLLLVAQASGSRPVLGGIAFAGALFVAYLGVESLRARVPDPEAPPARPRSLWKGVIANVLNPHPYLFWIAVGAPLLLGAWRDSVGAAVLFLVAFYGCLVGSKVALAWLTARSRRLLEGRAYRWTLRGLGVALLVFAVLLVRDGLRLIG